MKQPKISLVFITPQMALEMLTRNTMNRRIKAQAVQRIEQTIVNDKFIVTNNAIGFDTNGVLTDGQHRLLAIVHANKGVWSFVATDLEPTARLIVDTNSVRTHANSLEIEKIGTYEITIDGVTRKKNCAKLLASVSAYIMLHQTNQFNKVQAFGKVITNEELVEFVKANEKELAKSVVTTLEMTGACTYVQDTHMFFVYQMHKFFNEQRIAQFIRIVCGTEVAKTPETCPATKLKIALITNHEKRNGTKYNTKDLLGMVIDASNKFMQNVEMKPKTKLVGRPNDANLVNVQFTGDLTAEATNFFNKIKHPKKVVIG
jgi:hypothetical protein